MFHPGGVRGARQIAQSLHHVKNAIRGTCSSRLLLQQKAAAAIAVASGKGTITPAPSGPAAPALPVVSSQVEVYIDDKMVMVEPGTTILQAAALTGVEIPRFCYHDRLSIAGNCRMCLVEVEKSVKPVAACAMPVMKVCVLSRDFFDLS